MEVRKDNKKNKFILLTMLMMQIFALSACGKNEAGVPYGEYKNEECGTIVLDKEGVTFKDMDPDYINERRAGAQSALDYFENRDEGMILSGDEVQELKDKYYSEMKDDDYTECVLSYECEEMDDYYVGFSIYDGEKYITGFSYDKENKTIEYGNNKFGLD